MNQWPVLLTATIYPHPHATGKLTAPDVRKKQYCVVLKSLLRSSSGVEQVVFCENSAADLSWCHALQVQYLSNKKKLVSYSISPPDGMPFYGKGWGEGYMLKRALENVPVLDHADAFIKISGRYKVTNLKKIIYIITRAVMMHPDLMFVCQPLVQKKQPFISSQLFWANRKFYADYLMDIYENVRDDKGVFLEHVLAQRIQHLCCSYKIGILPIYPIIQAVDGWNAKPVMTTRHMIKEKLKQMLLPLPEIKFLHSERLIP